MATKRCEICLREAPGPDTLTSGPKSFHPKCFKCSECMMSLVNAGVKYYFRPPAADKPQASLICDNCYLNSRPTCGACGEKIVGNAGFLQSCGKVWHLDCFVCKNCRTSL